MKQIKRLSSTLAVLSLALVFVTAPVSARGGADDGTVSGSTSSTSGSTSTTSGSGSGSTTETSHSGSGSGSGSTPTTQSTETEHTTEAQNAEDSANEVELHKKGNDMVAELRKEHTKDKVKTPQEHKKVCEAHKKGLQTKFTSIVGNSQRAQTRIASIHSKADNFQETEKVQVENFASLQATAEAAEAKSSASIGALQAVTPSLDCNNVSVASDVATFKAAAEKTRHDLKEFKSAVQAELHSLETAKPAKTETTEGSN